MAIRDRAFWFSGLLIGSGLIGCGLLYKPYEGPNQNHCANNRSLCSESQQCDLSTGLCFNANVDLAMMPQPDQAAAVDMTAEADLTPALPAPIVTSVSPQGGMNSASTFITVTGSNFRAGAVASVGGQPCANAAVISATQITCTVPPKALTCGRQDVVVTHPDDLKSGTGVKLFTYRSSIPFASPSMIMTGNRPGNLITADFNNDGKLDLVNLLEGLNQVEVRLGVGNGTFLSGVPFSVGTYPAGIVAADLNKDGYADLLVCNQTSNNLTVLDGDGLGGFAAKRNFATGTTPLRLAVADVNGDNNLDVVVTNSGASSVSVFIGNGMGGLTKQPVDVSVQSTPFDVAVGDLNADNKPDLVVTHNPGTGPSIRIGNGDGTFGMGTNPNYGGDSQGVALFDVNKDLKLDLIMSLGSQNLLSYSPGVGDATFGSPVSLPAGGGPRAPVLADLDGDGVMDYLVSNGPNANVSLFYGGPNATFVPALAIPTGASPRLVAVGDFNGDTVLDFAVPNNNDDVIGLYLGQCR